MENLGDVLPGFAGWASATAAPKNPQTKFLLVLRSFCGFHHSVVNTVAWFSTRSASCVAGLHPLSKQ